MTFGAYTYGSSSIGGSVLIPGSTNIIITDIVAGTTHCINECNVVCPSVGCSLPIIMNVVVTWQNTGDTIGTFIPILNVTPQDSLILTTYTLSQVVLAAGDTIHTTFTDINFGADGNNVCANTG